MTEDEARKKWCPMVRMTVKPSTMLEKLVIGNNRGGAASDKGEVISTSCIASDCMAWRTVQHFGPCEPGTTKDTIVYAGYCGLAGKL